MIVRHISRHWSPYTTHKLAFQGPLLITKPENQQKTRLQELVTERADGSETVLEEYIPFQKIVRGFHHSLPGSFGAFNGGIFALVHASGRLPDLPCTPAPCSSMAKKTSTSSGRGCKFACSNRPEHHAFGVITPFSFHDTGQICKTAVSCFNTGNINMT